MNRPRYRTAAGAILTVAVAATLAGCSTSASASQDTSTAKDKSTGALVIYTPNDQNMLDAIIPVFEKESGIKVQLVTAGTGELYQRIQSEAGNPGGDVLFGGSEAQAVQNEKLWAKYTSTNNKDMIAAGKNVDGVITPYVADGSNLLVNTEKIGDIKISGYESLLNPKLKGRIAFGDPSQSSSAFAQLTNMLKAMGGNYTSATGWNYVRSLISNVSGKVIPSSAEVVKDVADGEYPVGLTYEDPSATYVRAGSPVKVVYPTEGAVYLPSGTEIIQGAKNLKSAKQFVDFVTSKKAQDIFGSKLTNRPLREDAKLGNYMTPLSDIHVIQEDTAYVAAHKSEIVTKYQQLFAQAQ
ncbi:MAG TPA: extracellular solute-binding protein [Humibacter sp.]|nr:extracellular solute-binding protein [Humibacter sp.]